MSALLALASGALGALALLELASAAGDALRPRLARAGGALAGLTEALARASREGRDPGAAERRRLALAGAAVAFAGGLVAAGPVVGIVAGCAGPWAVARGLAARRERYRRAVDAGAPAAAVGLADALAGGHSLRGAVAEAAQTVPGAAGRELRRAGAELAAGAPTDEALEALRARAGSRRFDTLVAACLLQRRAGGDLARLLRECGAAFEDETRLRDEVRAATAQARFTGLVVVLLPLGGALLAELAAPGFLLELWHSPLTAWLAGLALVLQAAAALLIRRLGRVRW